MNNKEINNIEQLENQQQWTTMNNNKTNNNEQRLLLENRARRPCSTIVCKANLSRTVVSVPRPPARSRGIHSPLRRGGDGGGAVVEQGTETLFY